VATHGGNKEWGLGTEPLGERAQSHWQESKAFTAFPLQLKRFPEQIIYKKGQLSLTNPRDACEKFARFTKEQWGCKLYS